MLLPKDIFCRAAVFPRCITSKGIMDDACLLKFSGNGVETRSCSVVSFYLSRNESGVHDFGLKVAAEGNKRIVAAGKMLDDTNEDVYLGYYSFLAEAFIGVSMKVKGINELVTLVLYWKRENGDHRHFQIDIFPNSLRVKSHVEEEIASQAEAAARSNKKFNPPNKVRREERLVDSEVRLARQELFDILFGPVKCPDNGNQRLCYLQDKFLISLPLSRANLPEADFG